MSASAPIKPSVEDFRQRFREQEIGASYSGMLHFSFTAVVSLAVIVYAIVQTDAIQPLEWLTIPLTFLYANLSEYFGHRGPMHHPTRGLGIIYQRHTRQHHRFFTHENMSFGSSRDYKAVLFPPVMIVFFLSVFALPVGLVLAWFFSANVAWLFVAMAVGYFLNYEILHFAYHCDDDSWVRKIPGLEGLRQLHLLHHDPNRMQQRNFNITYPIGDWLFGTWDRGP